MLSTYFLTDAARWEATRAPLLQRLNALNSAPVDVEFFHSGITVVDATGDVQAACALYHNPTLCWEGAPAACFGNFDSENNPGVARLLVESASEISRGMGKTTLLGPMNGSTWSSYRLAVDAFDTTYLLDLQHPPYYADLLRQAGMVTAGRYMTARNSDLSFDRAYLETAQRALTAQNLVFRPIDLDRYEAELAKIYDFCMQVFAHNVLFTPISSAGFYAKYRPIQPFIRPEYVILCEEPSGALCAMLFAIPNYADTQHKGIIFKTIARNPAAQFNGVTSLMGDILHRQMQADGFEYVLHAFMEQHNPSVNLSKHFHGDIIKNYELFVKML